MKAWKMTLVRMRTKPSHWVDLRDCPVSLDPSQVTRWGTHRVDGRNGARIHGEFMDGTRVAVYLSDATGEDRKFLKALRKQLPTATHRNPVKWRVDAQETT